METKVINSEKLMITDSVAKNSGRKAMRRYIYLFTILTLFVVGCSEQSSMLAPVNTNTTEPNWIALPQTEGMQVNEVYSTSKLIDSKAGGSISLSYSYNGGLFGKVTCTSSLQFPKGAFVGKETFTVSHDDATCSSTFGPSYVFIKKLIFDIRYTGIDLTGIDIASLRFAYIAADGSIEYAINNGIVIDYKIGKIEVKDAQLPHFSRYGFVNVTY